MKVRYGSISVLFTLLFLLPTLAFSQTVVTTIYLDNVPDVACGEVWVQNGVNMHFTQTLPEDCDQGGNCFFGIGTGTEGVWLYPARLVADFGQNYSVSKVEVDINDNCGIGCTKAFLYNGGVMVGSTENTTVGSPEVLTVVPSGGEADLFAVSSCEGQVLGSTIRIYATVVSNEDTSWSVMKSQYR